ncbi:MAG TPA: ATP-grasp domain-containing protein [Ktedonobacteraceae bacterium]|nr:ATP-grasp domain-containing protein [Ktedonobacteraceae bacterium]
MRFIFCSDYWNPLAPDSAYEDEVNAVQKLGLSYSLIDFEVLVEQGDAERSVRRVEPANVEETAVYRGWMLKPQMYERLYHALREKGLALINTPEAYKHCHYLPEVYPVLAGFTPASTWLRTGPEVSMDEVMAMLQPFGNKPMIVKDFVKSRKHEWHEACYIQSAANRVEVERVVRRFIQLQGRELNEGLVFREFVEFEPLTTHPRSGLPLSREYRLFVLDGQIIFVTPYWEEGDYTTGEAPPLDPFREIAQKIKSRFCTMDVARKMDGTWTIVEPGDGQVAGLPAHADREAFYRALANGLRQ